MDRYEPRTQLRLAAEMNVPGRAWLEYSIVPAPQGALIRQTAMFDPMGLAGLLSWYALVPVHALVFPGMLRSIARRATRPNANVACVPDAASDITGDLPSYRDD